MEIIRTENPQAEAGHALSSALLRHKAHPILLMLSGGSAFEMLAYVDTEVLGPHLTLSVLDERYATDPHVNNFAQLSQTDFYARATASGAGVVSTEVRSQTSIELSEEWMRALYTWKREHPDGVVLATMGIGDDGHTAGMFPQVTEADFSGESLVVSYSVPEGIHQYRERITTTFTFLTEWVDEAIVYAAGEGKKGVLAKLEKGESSPEEMPACIMHEMQSVKLYTDIIE